MSYHLLLSHVMQLNVGGNAWRCSFCAFISHTNTLHVSSLMKPPLQTEEVQASNCQFVIPLVDRSGHPMLFGSCTSLTRLWHPDKGIAMGAPVAPESLRLKALHLR